MRRIILILEFNKELEIIRNTTGAWIKENNMCFLYINLRKQIRSKGKLLNLDDKIGLQISKVYIIVHLFNSYLHSPGAIWKEDKLGY